MTIKTAERQLEEALVTKLQSLKYEYRPDIRDRAKLEQNFREKFEALNRVRLTQPVEIGQNPQGSPQNGWTGAPRG